MKELFGCSHKRLHLFCSGAQEGEEALGGVGSTDPSVCGNTLPCIPLPVLPLPFRGLWTAPQATVHPPGAARKGARHGKAISYLLAMAKQSREDAAGSEPTLSDGSFITKSTFLSLKQAGVLCTGSAEPRRTPGTFPEPSRLQLSTGTRLSPGFFFFYPMGDLSLYRSHLPVTCSLSKKRFGKRRWLLAAGEQHPSGCGLWLPWDGSFVFSLLGVCVSILFLYTTEPPLISATGSENRNSFTD